MAGWHLTTLGARPALARPGREPVTRLRSRRAFALLASLALDPDTCAVDALADRLWPDAPSPSAARTNLRTAVLLLRQEADPDLFDNARGIVRLAPGALSGGVDLLDAEAAWEAARRTPPDAVSPGAQAARLRAAARLLPDGRFLEWLDVSDPWLDRTRYRADALAADLHRALALALEATGDPGERRAAFDAARRAYALRPDREDALDLVLRLADGPADREAARRAAREAGTLDELVPRLSDAARGAPTVGEERALDAALDAALRPLPERLRTAWARLGAFPQSFTAAQAGYVGGPSALDAAALARLADASLLQQSEAARQARFRLPPLLRERALARLTPAQRRTAFARHARYFARFDGRGWPDFARPDDPALRRYIAEERENWKQALGACLDRGPLDAPTLKFVQGLADGAAASADGRGWEAEVLGRATPRLEEAFRAAGPLPAPYLATLLSCAAFGRGDFAASLGWAAAALDRWQEMPPGDAREAARRAEAGMGNTVFWLLQAAHHAGDDALFDRAVGVADALLECLSPLGEHALLLRRHGFVTLRAENLYARGRFEEALALNAERGALVERILSHDHAPRAAWRSGHRYQRGCLLHRLGRADEALGEFDAALALYRETGAGERHGVADCLQQMAAILGTRPGFSALAREQAERAVEIYAEIGAEGSRAAALGTLGDLLAADPARAGEARALYEEGRAYWRAQGHDRWVARFDARLAKLE